MTGGTVAKGTGDRAAIVDPCRNRLRPERRDVEERSVSIPDEQRAITEPAGDLPAVIDTQDLGADDSRYIDGLRIPLRIPQKPARKARRPGFAVVTGNLARTVDPHRIGVGAQLNFREAAVRTPEKAIGDQPNGEAVADDVTTVIDRMRRGGSGHEVRRVKYGVGTAVGATDESVRARRAIEPARDLATVVDAERKGATRKCVGHFDRRVGRPGPHKAVESGGILIVADDLSVVVDSGYGAGIRSRRIERDQRVGLGVREWDEYKQDSGLGKLHGISGSRRGGCLLSIVVWKAPAVKRYPNLHPAALKWP